jgi:hypothetical protein
MSIVWTTDKYTIQEAYRDIAANITDETPWVPFKNFTNDFFDYHDNERADLIREPIVLPDDATVEQRRWAVFCAAAVEYLCQKYALGCPEWVFSPALGPLEQPWHFSLSADADIQRAYEDETPRVFAQRHIYCGDRVLLNKKEEAAKLKARLAKHLAQLKKQGAMASLKEKDPISSTI